jgi:plastocyanin
VRSLEQDSISANVNRPTHSIMIAFEQNKPNKLPPIRPFLRQILLSVLGVATFVFVSALPATAATVTVEVGPGGSLVFSPFSVSIQRGDTVMWVWKGFMHSVTSGAPGSPTGLFDSGIRNPGATFSFTFPNPGTFSYFCEPHGACCGMVGNVMVAGATPTPTPTPGPGTVLGNISTRLDVETGDNVLIGGFIVTGTQPKKVIVRAIGPSLNVNGVPVPGRLGNPTLDLDGPGGLIASNDDWRSTQEAEIIASTVPPTSDLESAIVATLPASATGIGYTAVMRGVNNTTGIGLVEAFDLDRTVDSKLANISTRGFVQTGDNVMIGGVIVLGTGSQKVIVRAIGPSLPVTGPLADPVLELHDSNGLLLAMNDNWRDTQEAEIIATTVPPTNDLESAIVATLLASATGVGYTAIVSGANGTTGVALVEVFALAP